MEFSRALRPKVAAGSITVSFRLWQRPMVPVGGTYAVGDAHIKVDAVDLIPFYAISADDLRRSGEADRESLRQRAAHAGPVNDDTVLYRIEFHVVRPRRVETDRAGAKSRREEREASDRRR